MPIYEYKCDPCGDHFECRQGFESEPFAECPKCGKIARRQLQCPPIIFKGSGFYITDHRKESDSDTSKPAKPAAKNGEKAEKADKPEAKKTEKSEKAEKSETAGKSESVAAKKD